MEPLKFRFKNYIVNNEEDFVEDGIDKILVKLTVCIETVGTIGNTPPIMTRDLEFINLNSQTGEEMDAQRTAECIAFVAANFNV